METWLQMRLSATTRVNLAVDGPMGAREYRQLMRVLALIGEMYEQERSYTGVLKEAIEAAEMTETAAHT